MVEAFAADLGLCLPMASGEIVCEDFFDVLFSGLTHHQTMFLDFTQALLVRFCRLWNSRCVPQTLGAKRILEDPQFATKKLGHWMHSLDRSSLQCHSRVLLPWRKGLLETNSMIVSVIGNVTLCSSSAVAKRLLPLPSDPEALQHKLKSLDMCSCRFAYPRALIRVAHGLTESVKIENLVRIHHVSISSVPQTQH